MDPYDTAHTFLSHMEDPARPFRTRIVSMKMVVPNGADQKQLKGIHDTLKESTEGMIDFDLSLLYILLVYLNADDCVQKTACHDATHTYS